jgi:hypothetical protein
VIFHSCILIVFVTVSFLIHRKEIHTWFLLSTFIYYILLSWHESDMEILIQSVLINALCKIYFQKCYLGEMIEIPVKDFVFWCINLTSKVKLYMTQMKKEFLVTGIIISIRPWKSFWCKTGSFFTLFEALTDGLAVTHHWQ